MKARGCKQASQGLLSRRQGHTQGIKARDRGPQEEQSEV